MKLLKPENLFQFAFVCLSIGLLYSRFLISIGMLLFLVAGVSNYQQSGKLIGFINNRYYLSVTIIFFLFLISGLWSEDTDYFLNRMRIKLPFLFLPFAFYLSPRLSKDIMQRLMLFFIGLIVCSVLWSTIMFLTDYSYYISIYGKGQILPTPIHHIRYSLLVATAVLMSIYLVLSQPALILKNQKKILSIIVVLLSVYLHVLAVRSGLMGLYVVIGSIIIYFAMQKQYRKKAGILLLVSIVSLLIAINYVPTIKNKIGYMNYSLELFAKNENIRHLSDSRRLGSIFAGLQLIKENPVLGVGIGDIMEETNQYLELHYPELTDLELLPHNQYILTGASIGILGMLIFIFCSIYPLFYYKGYNDIFMLGSFLMLTASFMVEHTIESQIGVAAYIFVLLFSMKNLESLNKENA